MLTIAQRAPLHCLTPLPCRRYGWLPTLFLTQTTAHHSLNACLRGAFEEGKRANSAR